MSSVAFYGGEMAWGTVRNACPTFREAQLNARAEAAASLGQQHSQIAQIISRRPSDNRIAECVEESVGIAPARKVLRIEPSRAGTGQRLAVRHGASRGTRAVDAVSARAQHPNAFPG